MANLLTDAAPAGASGSSTIPRPQGGRHRGDRPTSARRIAESRQLPTPAVAVTSPPKCPVGQDTQAQAECAMLPDLGKLQPTKLAGDARCRSPLAAAM